MEGIQYGIQQGYNPMTAAYVTQPYANQCGQPREYGQQGLFAGNPLSGLMNSGIPGLFGGQNLGRQPGQVANGFGGMFQTFGNPNIDPMIAAQIQQSQLGQQTQFGPQVQAHLAQQAQLALLAQQQLGRTPFSLDPISATIAQQRQFAQQPQFGPQGHGQQPQLAAWFGVNPLNRIDPVTAAYIQQGQIAQLVQQLALQNQLGQQNQFGQQVGQGHFGQDQFGHGWLGGGLNPWASLQLAAQYGRTQPWQYGSIGYGGQLPIY